jgi:hypothetical protein
MPLGMTLLGGLLFFGVSTPARATFAISFTTSAGTTTIADGSGMDSNTAAGKIGFSGSLGGFDITVFLSTSNSPGTPYFAQLTVGTLDLINTLGTSNSISIQAVDQGYMSGLPNVPMGLVSSVSGMVTQSAGDTSTIGFQSYADAANNGPATFPFATAFQTNPLTASLTGVDGSSQGFSLTTRKFGFTDPAQPFSMASKLDITLAGNANLNAVSGKTEMVVPVPASLALALTGLPCLGLAYGVRRRRAAVQM